MGSSTDLGRNAPITKMTCVALSIANLLAMPTSASAADITVDASCSIVDAVIAANSNTATGNCVAGEPDATATDVIILPDNSIQLFSAGFVGDTNNALPVISSDITIQGNGSTLRRNSIDSFRLIKVEGAGTHLTINDLTIENGSSNSIGGGIYAASYTSVSLTNSTVSGNSASSSAGGGGIYAVSSSVSLSNSTVSGNYANNGGGIRARNSSTISLSNSTVSGNSASNVGGIYAISNSSVSLSNSTVSGNSANSAGGIHAFYSSVSLSNSTVSGNSATTGGGIRARNSSTISLSNSTVSGNSASSGGGIHAINSSVSLSNSTVSGNSANNSGGGILADSSSVSLTNSTVSGNSANRDGGGIYARKSSSVSLSNSTVSGNSANDDGGGIYAFNSSVSLTNSIIANSSNNDDIDDAGSLTLTSDTASIIEEASFRGSRTGDPDLLPLADNGGPTQTHALSNMSIALDTGDTATCTDRDQRGRLRDTPCNVGSFEVGTGDIMVGVAGCTLIDAVRASNTNTAIGGCEPGEPDSLATDMIALPSNSTQTMTAGYIGDIINALPVISSNITILGNGSTLRRDSLDEFRLIKVEGSETTLTINNLSIENGHSPDNLSGGGIFVSGGAELNLSNSNISGNYASYCGGGIDARIGSSVNINNSTISANSAPFGGGLSAFDSSSFELVNSTVSGNVGAYGGGMNISDNSIVSLTNGTVSGNSANGGGGIYAYISSISLTNSIIANSSDNDDVYLVSYDTYLSSDSASIIEEASFSGSRTGDPGLLPLANNGGFTNTHALKANSVARDSGLLANCTIEDQRGQLRDDGDGQCDVGALEYNVEDVGSEPDETSFYVIPLGNGKVAVIRL